MISPTYSPKLSLPRHGRRVVESGQALGAGRVRARVPVPVRVQAAALRKASGHGVAKAGLCILDLSWLSSVIGGVSFFRRLPPECVMLLLLHEASAGACRSQ